MAEFRGWSPFSSQFGQEVPTVAEPRQKGPSKWDYIIPAAGVALGALGTWYSNRQSAKEAQKDRDFQADQSATSHQREVADLIASGLNPILSANSGASSPGGAMAGVDDIGGGISRALEAALKVGQAKAQISLTNAQADQASSAAAASRQQTFESGFGMPDRLSILQSRKRFEEASASEKEQMIPLLVAQAKEEVQRTLAGSAALKATAAIDKARLTGFKNLEEFERSMGEGGPAFRLLIEALRSLSGYAR